MKARFVFLFAVCLSVLVSFPSFTCAGCFDYTEGLSEEVPLYKICAPNGTCVQTRLNQECGNQEWILQRFSNGIGTDCTLDKTTGVSKFVIWVYVGDESSNTMKTLPLCEDSECKKWLIEEIGHVPFAKSQKEMK